jgi:hypothetical protein
MTVNNNLSDVTLGHHDNMKINDNLSNYIKRVSNIDYFQQIFEHWKLALIDITTKLEKKFGSLKHASHFSKVLELMANMIKVQEEKIKPGGDAYLVDFNILDKEMNEVFKEITDELNRDELFRSTSEIIYTQCSTPKANCEDDMLLDINPKQIFFNSKEMPIDNLYEFKSHFEKKSENLKIETLNLYDYNKMAGCEVDLNKDIDDYEATFYKVFKPLFYTEKSIQDRKMLESEIDIYKTKHDRILKDQEALKLYNLKFEHMTMFQHLTLLWGLKNYALNKNILAEIPNIYPFSKSIAFEPEEIFINLDMQLHNKYSVDLLVSNVETLGSYIRSNSKYILPVDPPMLNSIHYNFFYNKRILDYVKNKECVIIRDEVGKDSNTDSDFMIKRFITEKGFTGNYDSFKLIDDNPILDKAELKVDTNKKMIKELTNIIEKVINKYAQTEHVYLKKVIFVNSLGCYDESC